MIAATYWKELKNVLPDSREIDMGTWGLKTFENDHASDWAMDLLSTHKLEFLNSSFHQKEIDDYLEAPGAEVILCAAEVVAGLAAKPRESIPKEILNWIGNHKNSDISKLIPIAITKVQRVIAEKSELNELWAENKEDYAAWRKDVNQLHDLLKSLPYPLIKPWWKFW